MTLHGQQIRAGDGEAMKALVERAAAIGGGAAPVERWDPPFCGDIDMEIRREGTWYYLGTPIARMRMVRLFASVLRKDADGRTYLVTPVERVGIRVEDAPFVAVEMAVLGDGPARRISFRTNVGDVVEAGPDHALRFAEEAGTGGLKPYLTVRGRLEALVSRAVAHELLALAEECVVEGRPFFAVRSGGMDFPVMPADHLSVSAS